MMSNQIMFLFYLCCVILPDGDVCYVEWRLSTPGNWNVDEIKRSLEYISHGMGELFRIVFIYTESAPIPSMQIDKEQLSVKSVFKDSIKISDVNMETKTTEKDRPDASQEDCDSCMYFISVTKIKIKANILALVL